MWLSLERACCAVDGREADRGAVRLVLWVALVGVLVCGMALVLDKLIVVAYLRPATDKTVLRVTR